MKGRLIAVEGPIAAGKTTLARLLADRLGAELVLEPVEENPFLSRFYEDPRALAFRTQLFFLVNRFHEQGQIAALIGRGQDVVADYLFAKDRVFAQLNLSGEELGLYDDVFRLIEPRAPEADLVVLLRADVDTLMAPADAYSRIRWTPPTWSASYRPTRCSPTSWRTRRPSRSTPPRRPRPKSIGSCGT